VSHHPLTENTDLSTPMGRRKLQDSLNSHSTSVSILTSKIEALEAAIGEVGADGSITSLVDLWDDDGPGIDVAAPVLVVLPAGSAFPTTKTWYADASETVKVWEKTITRNSKQQPTTIKWVHYDGATVIKTITDTITYDGAFEATHTRVVA